MKKALLVIDVQEGWRDKNYPYHLGDFKQLVKNVKKLIQHCRKKRIPVIFTRHVINEENAERFAPKPLDCFVEGTPQTEIMQEIRELIKPEDYVIEKHRFSAFFKTKLEEILARLKVEELVFTGIMTNCCVRSTILDAYYCDFKIIVISDACGTDSEKTSSYTLQDLENLMYGIEVLKAKEWIEKES